MGVKTAFDFSEENNPKYHAKDPDLKVSSEKLPGFFLTKKTFRLDPFSHIDRIIQLFSINGGQNDTQISKSILI